MCLHTRAHSQLFGIYWSSTTGNDSGDPLNFYFINGKRARKRINISAACMCSVCAVPEDDLDALQYGASKSNDMPDVVDSNKLFAIESNPANQEHAERNASKSIPDRS